MKLDKLPNYFCFAHHFSDTQNEIGRCHAIPQRSTHVHTNNVRRQEIHRLAHHRSLGFDATDSPTNNSESINHRRVGICSDESVREINVCKPNILGEIFEVHLVTDPNPWRYDAESAKSLSTPLQELVTGAISLELHLHILLESITSAGEIDLD